MICIREDEPTMDNETQYLNSFKSPSSLECLGMGEQNPVSEDVESLFIHPTPTCRSESVFSFGSYEGGEVGVGVVGGEVGVGVVVG